MFSVSVTILIIFISNLPFSQNLPRTNNKSLPFQTDLVNFLQHLSLNHFASCDYIFSYDQIDHSSLFGNGYFIENLLSNIDKSYFNLLFTPNTKINTNSAILQNLSPFNDIHRLNSYCNLVFLQISQINSDTSDILFELLTKRHGPLTKKDEDYYVILTQMAILDQITHMMFIQKIKFKIIISPDSDWNKLAFKNTRFFLRKGEEPSFDIDLNLQSRSYNNKQGLSDIFPDLLWDFEGRTIRVSSPIRILFILEMMRNNNKWELVRGQHAIVLLEIQKIFNFTFDLYAGFGGGGTGFAYPNGTWTGTVSDILYDRSDLALVTGQVYHRYPLIGFSRPFLFTRFAFTVGKPKNIYTYKTLFWPFTPNIWLLSSISTLLVTLIFILFNNRHHFINNTATARSSSSVYYWEVAPTLIFIFGSFFEQGLTAIHQQKSSKRNSHNSDSYSRAFCITWLFFLMILATVYRSKLVTFLAFPKTSQVPETFSELVETTSGYKYGLESSGIGAAIHNALKASTNPIFVKINREMSLEYDSVKCFLKGIQDTFACLTYTGQFEYIFYKNFSTRSRSYPFQISKEITFAPHSSGFAMEKRASFRTNFDSIFRYMYDSGIIDRWTLLDYENVRSKRIKWEIESKSKPIFDDRLFAKGPRKLALRNLQGIFLVYGLLKSFCILGLILELVYQKMSYKMHRVYSKSNFEIPTIEINFI